MPLLASVCDIPVIIHLVGASAFCRSRKLGDGNCASGTHSPIHRVNPQQGELERKLAVEP